VPVEGELPLIPIIAISAATLILLIALLLLVWYCCCRTEVKGDWPDALEDWLECVSAVEPGHCPFCGRYAELIENEETEHGPLTFFRLCSDCSMKLGLDDDNASQRFQEDEEEPPLGPHGTEGIADYTQFAAPPGHTRPLPKVAVNNENVAAAPDLTRVHPEDAANYQNVAAAPGPARSQPQAPTTLYTEQDVLLDNRGSNTGSVIRLGMESRWKTEAARVAQPPGPTAADGHGPPSSDDAEARAYAAQPARSSATPKRAAASVNSTHTQLPPSWQSGSGFASSGARSSTAGARSQAMSEPRMETSSDSEGSPPLRQSSRYRRKTSRASSSRASRPRGQESRTRSEQPGSRGGADARVYGRGLSGGPGDF